MLPEPEVEDSKEAQTAVSQALTVLKEFYAKAAQGAENMKIGYDGRTRLIQTGQPEVLRGVWAALHPTYQKTIVHPTRLQAVR